VIRRRRGGIPRGVACPRLGDPDTGASEFFGTLGDDCGVLAAANAEAGRGLQ